MNSDHADDNLLIARAFTEPPVEISDAVMAWFDGDGGVWQITVNGSASELRVPWPGGPITDRPAVRRAVVALYDQACARLGIKPRPHT